MPKDEKWPFIGGGGERFFESVEKSLFYSFASEAFRTLQEKFLS